VKKDVTGNELYSIHFNDGDLITSDHTISEFDLPMKVFSSDLLSQDSILLKLLKTDKKNKIDDSAILSFAQQEVLPVSAFVKILINNNSRIKPGSSIYLYSYNAKTNQLVELPNNCYQVGEDGYVTLNMVNGGDYVLLPNKPSNALVIPLLKQIKVTINNLQPSKLTLYVKKGKISTAKIKFNLPNTLVTVKTFSEQVSNPAKEEVKITYSTSDSKVATVSTSGKITAKKAGTVTITTTIFLRNGEKRVVKTKVKVHK
jgi:hypothetical protein